MCSRVDFVYTASHVNKVHFSWHTAGPVYNIIHKSRLDKWSGQTALVISAKHELDAAMGSIGQLRQITISGLLDQLIYLLHVSARTADICC